MPSARDSNEFGAVTWEVVLTSPSSATAAGSIAPQVPPWMTAKVPTGAPWTRIWMLVAPLGAGMSRARPLMPSGPIASMFTWVGSADPWAPTWAVGALTTSNRDSRPRRCAAINDFLLAFGNKISTSTSLYSPVFGSRTRTFLVFVTNFVPDLNNFCNCFLFCFLATLEIFLVFFANFAFFFACFSLCFYNSFFFF